MLDFWNWILQGVILLESYYYTTVFIYITDYKNNDKCLLWKAHSPCSYIFFFVHFGHRFILRCKSHSSCGHILRLIFPTLMGNEKGFFYSSFRHHCSSVFVRLKSNQKFILLLAFFSREKLVVLTDLRQLHLFTSSSAESMSRTYLAAVLFTCLTGD